MYRPVSNLKSVSKEVDLLVKTLSKDIFCDKLKHYDPHPLYVHGIKVIFNRILRLVCGIVQEDRMSVEKMLKKT